MTPFKDCKHANQAWKVDMSSGTCQDCGARVRLSDTGVGLVFVEDPDSQQAFRQWCADRGYSEYRWSAEILKHWVVTRRS